MFAIFQRRFPLFRFVHELLAARAQVDFLIQHFAHELALALKPDRFRQYRGQNFGRVAALDRLNRSITTCRWPSS